MKTIARLLLALATASLCSGGEIIMEFKRDNLAGLQRLLNRGYKTKALAFCTDRGLYEGYFVAVLEEPNTAEYAKEKERTEVEEAKRIERIKAEYAKKRADYLKSLASPEKSK